MRRGMRNMSRRTWLRRAAAGGAALAMAMAQLRRALAMGAVPPGVYRARGDVRINGKPAQKGVELKPGDVVTTGRDAELVVVVGKDAFLMRADSRVEYSGDATKLIVSGLRVVTGALLSVFEPGKPKTIRTATATIGIRGTGIYVEVEGKRTYACTCYGEAELVPVDDPAAAETVRTKHHDEPRFIYAKGMPRMMEKAPVFNHTDAELIMLEDLVGRTTPFSDTRY
jgi:ribosomal 50S subunit-recycling heat shock protein